LHPLFHHKFLWDFTFSTSVYFPLTSCIPCFSASASETSRLSIKFAVLDSCILCFSASASETITNVMCLIQNIGVASSVSAQVPMRLSYCCPYDVNDLELHPLFQRKCLSNGKNEANPEGDARLHPLF